MKYARFASVALLAVSFSAAGTPINAVDDAKWEKAKQSYIRLLSDPNAGVKASAADLIRKYKIVEAREALQEALECENCEMVKIYAAYALVHIAGIEGMEFLKKAAVKEENEIVRTFYRSLTAAGSEDINSPVSVN